MKYNELKKLALSVSLTVFWNLSFAQSDLNTLKVKDIAPDFQITDHNGVKINLYERLKSGRVVIVFYRGAWCPYCNKHMSHLQDSLQLILAKGASLIAITPEQNSSIEKTISKTKASFNVAFDSAYVIMKSYGTAFKLNDFTYKKYKLVGIDVEESNGNKDHMLTVPATFIINQDKTIEYIHFDENYKNRSTVAEILYHLK